MILVLGKSGQVATELALLGMPCFGRESADLETVDAAADLIRSKRPSAVINAAAYTAVDRAEEDEAGATRINATAVAEVAQACADLGIPLVHISTDYVFAGGGDTPWTTDAPTGPLGAYGRSKLAGEEALRASGAVFAILRTSWVVSAHGNNFVKTMLRLGAERDRLTIVADQVGGPTPARDIAAACHVMAQALMQDPSKAGTYHFSGGPDVSWADFAREIFAQAGLSPEVVDIPTTDFPTPAVRPPNSRMDCTTLETVFNIPRPDWRAGLRDILKDLKA